MQNKKPDDILLRVSKFTRTNPAIQRGGGKARLILATRQKQMAQILMGFFLIRPKPLNSNVVLCVLVTLLFFPSGGFAHNVGLCCVAPENDNSMTESLLCL